MGRNTALISPREEVITVITMDGKRVKADFVGLDSHTRLAVLKAKEKLPAAIACGKAEGLTPGAWVGVVSLSPENTPAVTQGIISSVAPDWLRLNVWVMGGASGSPVVNKDGQMIGLLRGAYFEDNPVLFEFHEQQVVGQGYAFSRAAAPSSGMAQAIPIDIVKDIYSQIKDKGKVERGWLGVQIGMNENGQTFMVTVDPESPAELAKIVEGDVVLKIGVRDVTTSDVLAAEIRKRKPGQDVTLKIERNGKPMDIKVKLGEFPENEAFREMELRFPGIFGPDMLPPAALAPKSALPGMAARSDAPRPLAPNTQEWSFETRKSIGLYGRELNPELAAYFGVKEGMGLLVSKLDEGGPAEKAKLQVGDVIIRADGKRVEFANDLIDLVLAKPKGSKIKLEILRDKKAMTIDVEVSEEESGGLFDSGDFQGFLESWQGYTDAFKNEINKWQSEGLPELRQNLKKISQKGLLKRI